MFIVVNYINFNAIFHTRMHRKRLRLQHCVCTYVCVSLCVFVRVYVGVKAFKCVIVWPLHFYVITALTNYIKCHK